MTRILIPLDILDDTHPALVAAKLSFPEAQRFLLHIVPLPQTTPPVGLASTYGAVYMDAGTQQRLASEARAALTSLGEGEVVTSGQAASEILRYAQSGTFDFILMGTAGRSGLGGLLLGSVAQAVIRASPIPVITLRAVEAASPQPRPVRRVAALYDFSPAARRALTFAREHFPQAQVDVLHASPPGVLGDALPTGHPDLATTVLSDGRQGWLERARTRLAEVGGGEIREGDPADLALSCAASGDYDLIALGTSSKGTLERLMFGSVAQKVIREAQIPVLTVGNHGG